MNTVENKNPMLSGLLNVIIPGSSQVYVNRDWGRFIGAFILGVAAFAAAIWVGNLAQSARGYALPQGLCTGVMLTIIVVVLFLSGHREAKNRNIHLNNIAFYNSKRTVSRESGDRQHNQIQTMRDEGLISKQEFDEKNARVDSKIKEG